MATKTKYRSPTLDLQITDEQYRDAKQSQSGGCLIADAIKKQHPHLSRVTVDMATIRVTDRKKGLRFMYLTPQDAQQLLLFYDQGWRKPTEQLRIARAVKIVPVISTAYQNKQRKEKIAALEEKKKTGGLTAYEKRSLAQLRNTPKRPTSRGKTQVNREGVVHGGRPSIQGKAHGNLLRGSDRHFGAKLADPGVVFTEAVDEALAAKLAEMNGE